MGCSADQSFDILTIRSITIDPPYGRLSEPLTLRVAYTLHEALIGSAWELEYEIDIAMGSAGFGGSPSRPMGPLTVFRSAQPHDLSVGEHMFEHMVAGIDVSGYKEHQLLQLGVMRLTLHSTTVADVISINMMTHVTKDEATGTLMRSVTNPLDEP